MIYHSYNFTNILVHFFENVLTSKTVSHVLLFPFLQLPPAPQTPFSLTPHQKLFKRQLLAAYLHAVDQHCGGWQAYCSTCSYQCLS